MRDPDAVDGDGPPLVWETPTRLCCGLVGGAAVGLPKWSHPLPPGQFGVPHRVGGQGDAHAQAGEDAA
ncbi:hypothetical protein NGM37_30340, partial [Streptomyces sp. TRM76130]|nr:hypothetical protein [Streptomyces sp. TRM76130]